MYRAFRCIIFLLVLFSLTPRPIVAQEVYICVWTNPERTMTRIFPEAKDYRTVTKKISLQELRTIEDRLKAKLLPGQRETYQYYEMLDDKGKLLGYILAASQKGEFGAIEFVFGIDLNLKIKGIYIQRARERDTEFKKSEFLGQFIGKKLEDADTMEIGKDVVAKTTGAAAAIVSGVRKELIAFDELALQRKD